MSGIKCVVLTAALFFRCGAGADLTGASADLTGASAVVIGTTNTLRRVARDGTNITLDHHTLLERRGDALHFVRGHVLVSSEHNIYLVTPFAQIRCEGPCTALLNRDDDGLEILNLGGAWTYRSAGDPTLYGVPEANQVSIGRVGPDGRAGHEFPQSLPWAPTVRAWGRLFDGTTAEFKTRLETFRGVWSVAVEKASEFQDARAKRNVAGAAAARLDAVAAEARAASANAKLRAEFRARLFDP